VSLKEKLKNRMSMASYSAGSNVDEKSQIVDLEDIFKIVDEVFEKEYEKTAIKSAPVEMTISKLINQEKNLADSIDDIERLLQEDMSQCTKSLLIEAEGTQKALLKRIQEVISNTKINVDLRI
jgi:hypothetical protein